MEGTDPASSCAPPLEPVFAKSVRAVCTLFGVHRGCPYKACRRASACATPSAVCYQAMEADMQPIVQSIIARQWRQSVEDGAEGDVAPACRAGFIRRIAREEEIARIRSGEFGGDDALTPYQLWLKDWAERCPGPAARRSRPVEPPDPDAKPHPPPAAARRPSRRTGRGAA